jgi:hypothetical protein
LCITLYTVIRGIGDERERERQRKRWRDGEKERDFLWIKEVLDISAYLDIMESDLVR